MLLKFGLIPLFILFAQVSYAQEEIKLSLYAHEFCLSYGAFFQCAVKGVTLNPTNEFIIELSDGNGDFSSPVTIGKEASVSPDQLIIGQFPSTTIPASGYRVRLRTTNPARIGPPNDADITIYPDLQVTLSAAPDGPVCDSTEVVFTANVTGGRPGSYSYHWYVNNLVEIGVDGGTFLKKPHKVGDIVKCQVWTDVCPDYYTTKEMEIVPRPNVTLTASPTEYFSENGRVICGPGIITLTAAISHANATSYQWYERNDFEVFPIGTDTSTIAVDFTQRVHGNYYCVVTHDSPSCYPTTSESELLYLTRRETTNPTVIIIPPSKICRGVKATFMGLMGVYTSDYQWTKNGQTVATGYQIYEDVVEEGDVIKLKVFSYDPCSPGEVESDPYIVPALEEGIVPVVKIRQYPEGDVAPGTMVVFAAETEGIDVRPLFNWFKNDVRVTPIEKGGEAEFEYGVYGGLFATMPENGDEIKVTMRTDICATLQSVTSAPLNVSVNNEAPQHTSRWVNKSSGPFNIGPSGFRIDNKGYVVSGKVQDGQLYRPTDQFWEYDVNTHSWTRKAPFDGRYEQRTNAAGFAANGTGFIGLGYNWITLKKDFWSYDLASNKWNSVTTFPGSGSLDAFSIGLGTKGYVGMLSDADNFGDFWEYDAVANNWAKLANFPGQKRFGLTGFVIGKKIFVGMGSIGSIFFNDFWEYDTESNVWSPKASFPGEPHVSASAFAVANTGFYGLGYDPQYKVAPAIWKYSPALDLWTVVKGFIPYNYGASLYNAVAIGLADRAVVYVSRRYHAGISLEFVPFVISKFEGHDDEVNKIDFEADVDFEPGNVFTIQVSTDSLFSDFKAVGTLTSSSSVGSIDVLIPSSAKGGKYVRIVSSKPAMATAAMFTEAAIGALLHAYPNPVNDRMTIKVSDEFLTAGANFIVVNETGQQILSSPLTSTEMTIDFSGKPLGLYLLRINSNQTVITKKIVVAPATH